MTRGHTAAPHTSVCTTSHSQHLPITWSPCRATSGQHAEPRWTEAHEPTPQGDRQQRDTRGSSQLAPKLQEGKKPICPPSSLTPLPALSRGRAPGLGRAVCFLSAATDEREAGSRGTRAARAAQSLGHIQNAGLAAVPSQHIQHRANPPRPRGQARLSVFSVFKHPETSHSNNSHLAGSGVNF